MITASQWHDIDNRNLCAALLMEPHPDLSPEHQDKPMTPDRRAMLDGYYRGVAGRRDLLGWLARARIDWIPRDQAMSDLLDRRRP